MLLVVLCHVFARACCLLIVVACVRSLVSLLTRPAWQGITLDDAIAAAKESEVGHPSPLSSNRHPAYGTMWKVLLVVLCND